MAVSLSVRVSRLFECGAGRAGERLILDSREFAGAKVTRPEDPELVDVFPVIGNRSLV